MAETKFGFQIGSSLATQYLTDSKYVRAGYIAVNTIAERDALPVDTGNGGVIVEGSLVYVSAEELFYQYDGSAWIEAEFGGGSQAYVVSTTDEPGFASTNQEITITTSFTDTEGTTHNVEDLKVGETIYVEESTYPNRWVADVYRESPTPGRLPEAYQEVEYLQSSGTQYIDTGVNVNSNIVLEQLCQYQNNGNTMVDGKNRTPYYFLGINNNNNYFYSGLGNNYSASTLINDENFHTLKLDGVQKTFSVDDNVLTTYASETFTSTSPIYLFRCNDIASYSFDVIGKKKWVKIWDNSTLVRNMIPCYRKSDNVAGLYDMANSGKNLFDKNIIRLGKLTATSNGAEISNANYKTTDFVPVEAGKTYSYQNNGSLHTSNFILFDANKNFINTIFNASTHTMESNVAYIRFNFGINDDISTFMLFKGTIATTYEPYPFYTNSGTGTFVVGPDANAVSNENTILSEGELVYKAKLFRVGKVDPADVTKAYVDTQDQAEATARAAADTALQNNINLKQDKLTSANAGDSIDIQDITTHSLPAAYQEVDYIECYGDHTLNNHIDTELILTQDHSIEMQFQKVLNSGFTGIAGDRTNVNSNNISIGINDSAPLVHCDFNNSDYSAYRAVVNSYSGDITKVIITTFVSKNERTIKFDGVIVGQNTTICSDTITTTNNCNLLFCNNMGNANIADIKCYYIKIWNNNTLIRHYIPCYRKSDNVIGLYDIINNVFYTNQGTGTFTKGYDRVHGVRISYTNTHNYQTDTQVAASISTHNTSNSAHQDIRNAIAGKEDVSNKTTILSSQSTDTQYPSAKVVYDNIEDVREIAEGKTNRYVVDDTVNPAFNSQADVIVLDDDFTDINGIVHTIDELKKGDDFLITDKNVPDRWVGNIANVGPAPDTQGNSSLVEIPRLPAEYQEVEYLRHKTTSYTDYIRTNYNNVVNSSQLGIKIKFKDLGGSWPRLCAIYASFYVVKYGTSYWMARLGSNSDMNLGTLELDTEHTFEFDKNSCYIDGTLIGTFETSVSFASQYYLDLFSGETHNIGFKGDIYSCEVRENDVLVHNYIPCYRISDQKPGFYDLVANEFITTTDTTNYEVGSAPSPQTDPTPERPMNIVSTTLLDEDSNSVELRGVGTYKDTYTANSTLITKNILYKQLTGTENWSFNSNEAWIPNAASEWGVIGSSGSNILCSHLCNNVGKTSSDLYIIMGSGHLTIKNPTLIPGVTDSTTLKTFIAAQYSAGTPVTILLPLSTPITETKELYVASEDPMAFLYQLETAKPKVVDVQVNGTTVVNPTTGVANVPIASQGTPGVIIAHSSYGLEIANSTGLCRIVPPNNSQIENKNAHYNPIVPGNLDKAVMEGLGNNSLTWTDQYKANARTTIGAGIPNTTKIDDITFTTETAEVLTRAEFDAKKQAGTLVEGVKYKIKGQAQEKLISGTNIKTLNNQSLLGSGNIDINSAIWGSITGTLSNQTDLQNALNAKSSVSASATGTSTTEAGYLTIDGVEWKLAGGGGSITGAVRYDTAQTLTDAQKAQAKTNIGLIIEILDEEDE